MNALKTDLSLIFSVSGLPAPSGSRRVVPIRRRDGSQTYRLVADKKVSDWIATVRCKAQEAMAGQPPWDGPLHVHLEFRFPRPKSHYRGGRRDKDRLRPNAPKLAAKRPDLDKLCRAILDALTGVVYLDDAQVAYLQARKAYTDDGPPCVYVSVSVRR